MDHIFRKRDIAWSDIKRKYEMYIPPYFPIKYTNDTKNNSNNANNYNNKYEVIISDSLDTALVLDNPLVLVFADDVNPGGCVDSGNGMQEESIFRRSALFKYLTKNLYPLLENQAIYCKNVPVCKNINLDDIETKYVSFLACPCIKMPRDPITDKEIDILKQKIRLIFKIAISNNHKNVVLGAWGCGVWGCNPKDISKYFKEISKYYPLNLHFQF